MLIVSPKTISLVSKNSFPKNLVEKAEFFPLRSSGSFFLNYELCFYFLNIRNVEWFKKNQRIILI